MNNKTDSLMDAIFDTLQYLYENNQDEYTKIVDEDDARLIIDRTCERLWKHLEDVPFVENKDKELVLDGEFLDFEKGTPREEIWQYFDEHHSKGVGYLLNDFDMEDHEEEAEK